MHELSIALGIVEAAASAANECRVLEVHLKLGRLSGVDPDALRSAFELAREEEPLLATAELLIQDVPITIQCPACDAERAVSFPELRCPECGTVTADVIRGRELEVISIEVEV